MIVITYAISSETGHVWSRFTVHGSTRGFAVPVLDFEGMKPENNFRATYNLQAWDNISTHDWDHLVWTKKIPVALKNVHRTFWGMKPLKGK